MTAAERRAACRAALRYPPVRWVWRGSLLDTTAGRCAAGCPASFEVDRIDDAQSEGWSVLLRGSAIVAGTGDEPAAVEPWAGGAPVRRVSLLPRIVTGRRIIVE